MKLIKVRQSGKFLNYNIGNYTMENNEKKQSIHFSSDSNEWYTPDYVFDSLNQRFNFTLDVAATKENAKCEKHFTINDDGLSKDWSNDTVWCNPPYGREISKWIEKAKQSNDDGGTVVMLIPARTDTKYWHDIIFPHASEIYFVKGRLKFGGAPNNAPFPSAIVVFGSKDSQIINTINFNN